MKDFPRDEMAIFILGIWLNLLKNRILREVFPVFISKRRRKKGD
jgi:hypothetical protein